MAQRLAAGSSCRSSSASIPAASPECSCSYATSSMTRASGSWLTSSMHRQAPIVVGWRGPVSISRGQSILCRASTGSPMAAPGRTADETYMKEYAALKDELLVNSRKAGGVVAAYLLLTVDGGAALCALAGSAANNAYLLWLFNDVDKMGPNTRVAMREAERVENPTLRKAAKLAAAYSHALQPRLLVMVALAALVAGLNKVLDPPLDLLHQGCVLGGFLSYKLALLLKIASDNSPKGYKSDEMSRPIIEKFDDELDQWGRPRKQIITLPTEALPDNVDTSNIPDLENIQSLEDALKALRTAADRKEDGSRKDDAEKAAGGPGRR